jgi:hypothetical protein
MKKNKTLEQQAIKLIGIKAFNKIVNTGNFTDSQFDKLFVLYQNEMPYGTQKARTGDPYEFIFNQLTKIHIFKRGKSNG